MFVDPLAIPELATVVMCWVLAVVLFRVGMPGGVARKLALLLAIEGIALLTSGLLFSFFSLFAPKMLEYLSDDSVWFQTQQIVHTLSDCAMLVFYPAFLAATLNTKLTRPFAGKRMRWGVLLASIALFFAIQFSSVELGTILLFATLSLMLGFALVASIHAWQVSPPGPVRTRAGVFALAFGFRDICWGFVYGSAIWQITIGVYGTADYPVYMYHIYFFGTLVYIPIIAYGILRTQLFDIDLKIRWTIKQSTLAGVFVAIMFVISEGASQFLSAELGNVAGLLAAAVVMFFLAPLQRFAERVASTAMPNTNNTPEYAAFRKMQVYEAAISEAQAEGGISHKERALLVRLRDSLGISETDAEAIELEWQTGNASIA